MERLPDLEHVLAVDQAIAAAEDVACGRISKVNLDALKRVEETARFLFHVDFPSRLFAADAARFAVYTAREAANHGSNAAKHAFEAAEQGCHAAGDGAGDAVAGAHFGTGSYTEAACQAGEAMERLFKSAVYSDLCALLALDLGRAGELGRPIDPAEKGPLGALWPEGQPPWHTQCVEQLRTMLIKGKDRGNIG